MSGVNIVMDEQEQPNPPSWEDANGETVKEILRLAEAKLAATLTIALAQDQRSATLTGIYGATAVALSVASLAAYERFSHSLGVAGLAMAACLFLASMVASRRARSVPFYTVGHRFSVTGAYAWGDVKLLMAGHAGNTDEAIDANARVLERSAFMINRALDIAALAPIAGLLGYLFS